MAYIAREHEKPAKEKARKRSQSAMSKAKELGAACGIFVAYIYWDPTYKRLDGAMHLPIGWEIPDINKYFRDLTSGSQRPIRRRQRRRMKKKTRPKIMDVITVEADDMDDSIFGVQTPEDQRSPEVVIHREQTCDGVPEVTSDRSSIVEVIGSVGTNKQLADGTTRDNLPTDRDCLMEGVEEAEADALKESNAMPAGVPMEVAMPVLDNQVYKGSADRLVLDIGPEPNDISSSNGLRSKAQEVVKMLMGFQQALRA